MSESMIMYLISALVVLLTPVVVQYLRLAQEKINMTKIGNQTEIDELFFSQLKLAVTELGDQAAIIKAKNDGSIPDEEAEKLRQEAIAIAKKNLSHHGSEFLTKLPEEASTTFINWWTEYMKRNK